MTAEAIATFVEAERVRFGVPGLAFALVVDGQVQLCEGFGVSDVAAGTPVTADTHFPLASDTKAFTAATLCLLAAQGAVDLDAPVRETVPWFALSTPVASELVTTRDLLSHRTGLPRHDLVWIGDSPLSFESVVRGLRHLELSRPPRTTWDYNNLAYITAGYLTEQVTGLPWEQVVRERLLAPLGMARTAFSVQDPVVEALALPYKAVKGEYELQKLSAKATADKAGPAGGLVSTLGELTAWVQARLGSSEVFPAAVIEELHTPAMLGGIAVEVFSEIQSLGYGLGCQVESYRGHRLVHHGGNITGYSSDVCVVPGAGIGLVVLTNLDSSYVRLAVMYGVLDRLLGYEPAPWGERILGLMNALAQGREDLTEQRRGATTAAAPSRPLSEFCGRFLHPSYGELSIATDGTQLVPDFHELGDRVRLEHRGHDVWDLYFSEDEVLCPLVFRQGEDGSISELAVRLEEAVAPVEFSRAT